METGDGLKIGMVLVALALFGIIYNSAVARVERSNYGRLVNTALLVIIGTLVTLAFATPLIGIKHALLVLACFSASGAPMAAGSYIRQLQRHQRDEAQVRELLKKGGLNDKTQTERIQHES